MWRSTDASKERIKELWALVEDEEGKTPERPPQHVLQRLIDQRLEDEDKWVQITAGCIARELGCEAPGAKRARAARS